MKKLGHITYGSQKPAYKQNILTAKLEKKMSKYILDNTLELKEQLCIHI